MKFDEVTIKNFRNFEDITIDLTNKNVLFGMNDVGKTNFLYALRFLFDKDIRRQNFTDTDYYKKNTNYSFNISYSGSTITLAYKGRSSSGQIIRVFGVN